MRTSFACTVPSPGFENSPVMDQYSVTTNFAISISRSQMKRMGVPGAQAQVGQMPEVVAGAVEQGNYNVVRGVVCPIDSGPMREPPAL